MNKQKQPFTITQRHLYTHLAECLFDITQDENWGDESDETPFTRDCVATTNPMSEVLAAIPRLNSMHRVDRLDACRIVRAAFIDGYSAMLVPGIEEIGEVRIVDENWNPQLVLVESELEY